MAKVIHPSQMPTVRPPLWQTAVVYLLMDHFGAGPLAWGIVGTLLGFVWLCYVASLFSDEWTKVDLK